ncbi:MAG TPA: molybdopterin-dependent oxidoreductase, partial [Tabrizicola sp.]
AAVQHFWQSPTIAETPGLKAVDMFRAVGEGRIKAIWIIHTNPVVSMPEADRVAKALAACPFVVVQDVTQDTDTARLAHVLLPAAAWAEKSGTVTNSERRISRQRAVLPPPGQARADWRILAEVAQRMGWPQAFGWESPAEVFAEHASLSGIAGALGSDFDISDHAGMTAGDYDALAPFLWPANPRQRGGRFFAEGRFHTPDGRGRMVAVLPKPVSPALPHTLNTGRIRDQWHTMTRTGKSPRLSAHLAEPFLELHPSDADRLGLQTAHLAEVTNPLGKAILRVLVTDRVPPGHPFAPIHWTGQTAPSGRIDVLVAANPDPVSGQPDSKASPVSIGTFDARWFGFAVSIDDIRPDCPYWAKARVSGGWRCELAGTEAPPDWEAFARATFTFPQATALSVVDDRRGLFRVAFHQDDRLCAAMFISRQPVVLSRDLVAAQLGARDAGGILAGRASAKQTDPGPIICACLNVGRNAILDAIETGRAATVAALGDLLGAGTCCGSCRPELADHIARLARREAAE